jgi:glycosyltransferase involved in cell wall biosynthesis
VTSPVARVPEVAAPAAAAEHALPTASVIIPAYNEAGIIVESLTAVHEYMHTLDGEFGWEIVVVDDGSTDGTGLLADNFAAVHDRVRVLHHRVNLKLGQALRFAFNHCTTDYFVTFDADLSYSPDHIGRLLRTIVDTSARIVVASPYNKDGTTTNIPFVRRIASRVANRILAGAARSDVTTLTGMVRAYDRRFLSSLNLKAMDTEINTEIIYKAQLLRARIVEIPAHLDWSYQRERQAERKSSIRMSRSTHSSVVMSFLFRPVLFFVIPGLIVLALATWMIVWIGIRVGQNFADAGGNLEQRFSEALSTAYDDRPYTFVVGGLAFVLGVQLLTLGIISMQAKRYFEELFHLGSSVLRRTRIDED